MEMRRRILVKKREAVERLHERDSQPSRTLFRRFPTTPPADTPPNAPSSRRSLKAVPQVSRKRPNYVLQRDYTVLAREKKVSTILEDLELRSKLESILQEQVEGKKKPKATRPPPGDWHDEISFKALQNIHKPAALSSHGILIPINDLRGEDASKYTPAEKQTRCKLAAVYRLVDIFGWSQLIYNHITVSCVVNFDDTCVHIKSLVKHLRPNPPGYYK